MEGLLTDIAVVLALMLLIAVPIAFVYGARRLIEAGRRRGELPVRPPELPLSHPWPGEIWWAMVPFADGSGAKDRPCLVLSVTDRSAVVVQITSKYHPRAQDAIELPPGSVDDRQGRVSYVRAAQRREIHPTAFRRRVGPVDPYVWHVMRWRSP
ncbi:type II toxin-antitoxin system PemK/MazF family toxin [Streptomyces sp. NPDC005963]|uniref:type II toxin-antitoxin system PemK/MazF family toxin n=1 Tax=Streptomyces sp. NPDC005963 TaxID=3156721 RepID=UPI0033FCAE89